MKLEIAHQQRYSRGELLLRTFLGYFYIIIPHGFCLFFLSIWAMILHLVTFFIILFTGKYPKNNFYYFLNLFRWNLRVSARLYNLADDYPAFGLDAADSKTELDIAYRENVSRGKAALVFFLGWLILIPHLFCIYFLAIGAWFVMLISWFAVLFTGEYPAGLHEYMVKFLRWLMRISMYLYFMYPDYPPFNGNRDEGFEIVADMKFAGA
jgi:hypothetical protein